MASNSTLADDDGDFEDWIEVQNQSPVTINLEGWALTDDDEDLTKWQFPATNLPPGGIILVFASNKDRRTPGATLHTNFRLSADGEYLALVDPSGTNIVTEFAPKFPAQVANVSFGFALTASNLTLVATGATGRVLVPSVANGGSGLNYTWTGLAANEPFNTSAWASGPTGVGFGAGGAGEIGLNLQSTMLNSNASAFLRLPFVLNNPTNVSLLTLRLKYDDGFVAWINGVGIARANAPEEDLSWNSVATSTHAASNYEEMTFGVPPNLLRSGTNILAIQGLNVAASNGSFLLLPELRGTSVAGESQSGVYFTEPTPGVENLGGSAALGPGIADVSHSPNVPLDNDNLLVTARIFPTLNPVGSVVLHFRVMFDPEQTATMFDDGAHGDGGSGDGIYGAYISAGLSASGQMVRYYVTAQDTTPTISRLPIFNDPASTAEYFGTVVNPAYVTSALPVVHLFAPNSVLQPGPTTIQIGADSDAGGRVSLFFDGEFYDNVFMFLRGNTTAMYNKKSHRIRFNSEHKFRSNESEQRLKNTSFVADYADPTYMRQGLSYWLCEEIGAPGPFYAPYRLQLNGAFYQLANHNDVHGEDLLERLGFDPNGALYNAMGTIEPPTINPDGSWSVFSNGGWDKKTRQWDTNGLDYIDLSAAIDTALSVSQRMTNIFDRLDLPEVINYMVAARIANESDDVRANMSIYYDNDGDRLWRIIPFDMNLSWGASYLLNASYNGIQATNDTLKSHPFYGATQAIPPEYIAPGDWNRLYDAIFAVPATREMFQRRMRTVLDAYVRSPGLAPEQSLIYQKAIAWRNLISGEAALDRGWWGWPAKNGQSNFDPGISLTNGVNILLNDFLDVRRRHLYGKHSVTNTALSIGINRTNNAGFPIAAPTNPIVSIVGWDYNPASGNQDEEYVQLTNTNNFAVDMSGWELDGGIHFEFQPGTVMPANSSLYVSPNTLTFRSRATSPRGGQGRFVVGPYSGHLNAWGESLILNDGVRLVSSNSFVGTPSLAQRYLRVTEIMYHPSPAPAITNDAQQFEFIEIKNISTNTSVNLANVRFTNGIYFNFTGSAVTTLLPLQSVLLVRNQAAFTARYGGGYLIAGQFGGALDNGGETLRLEDAAGEKILEFAYDDDWYPTTDGLGFSLVIVNENAPWDSWNKKSSWRASGVVNGSPGATDPVAPVLAPIIVNEVLTHTDLPDVDSVELFNPTTNTVNIGGWFLTDDFLAPKKYRIPNGTTILPNSYRVFDEGDFSVGPTAFRFSELGESVYLFSGDASTNLTGYYHGFDFGAAPNGISFGRYINSQTNVFFTLQSVETLDSFNALPRVGPIVISEIMYHPPDTNGVDNDIDEFLELQNITGNNVPLYDPGAPTNTWRLRNAVDFDFPTNQSLAGGSRLLVVGFNPTNAVQLALFRAKYNVPVNVAVYGPWSGKLDNSEETIELKQPDPPNVTPPTITIPFIMIDRVNYRDELPWPPGADELGNSLQRIVNTRFGNDPTNWFAAGVTAGNANVLNQAPLVAISSPTNGATVIASNGVTVSVQASDSGGSIALVRLFANDNQLAQWSAASSNYVWANPPSGSWTLTARATDNLGAVAESAPITVQIVAPAPVVAFVSPAPNAVVVQNSIVNLSVSPSAGSPPSTVNFFVDNVLFASVGSPFSVPWTATVDGPHVFTAIPNSADGQTGPATSVTNFVQRATHNPVMIPPSASNWRFLDNGSDQGTVWSGLAFNDGTWSTGTAQLGYGDSPPDETTVISFGPNSNNKYRTYYFRKTFVVPSLAGITNAILSVLRDDGAIAYVNGVEVYRGNMPSGPVTYLTLSSLPSNGAEESTFFPTNFSPSLLVVGTNVLAVEVHQNTTNSTDLSFDAQLVLQGDWLGPAFLVQPTNQAAAIGNNVTLVSAVAGSAPLSVRWYFNGQPLAATSATLTITNLQATNAGDYYVVATNFLGSATSTAATLVVLPPDSDSDGMPDDWELANGTNPFVSDAGLDLDLDGFNNLQEFIAGTSPTNSLSFLKFAQVRRGGANIEFNFTAASNRSYTVQQRLTAGGGVWSSWTNISPQPISRSIWLTNTTLDATSRFYRLATPAQP